MAHKTKSSDDLRVVRSRRLLQQALFDLTVEKGYAAVAISDIAERAMVNRSTFYRHYLDKPDLLRGVLDDLQAEAVRAARQAEHAPKTSPHVPAGLLALLKQVQARDRFFRVMLGKDGDPGFAHRFRQITARRYRDLFARLGPGDGHLPPPELRVAYIAHATLGAIVWWLEHGRPISAEQLAVWLSQLSLTAAGLSGARLAGADVD